MCLLDTHGALRAVHLRAPHCEAELVGLVRIQEELPVVKSHVGRELRRGDLLANGSYKLLPQHTLHVVHRVRPALGNGAHVRQGQAHACLRAGEDAVVSREGGEDVLPLLLQSPQLLREHQIPRGGREHQTRRRPRLGQRRQQLARGGLLYLVDAIFEHDGRHWYKDILQGQRAVIQLLRLNIAQVVDIVRQVGRPVGDGLEVCKGLQSLAVPPGRLALLGIAVNAEGGHQSGGVGHGAEQPADVHLLADGG
mmetsp:Transcript_56943/g.135748  ORF Transcript_56943/g.135748 Transcript_56943/m.135748 type:complete len:252 (-) Transcript_56943:596-1351(-)